jgi:hypothetical protein
MLLYTKRFTKTAAAIYALLFACSVISQNTPEQANKNFTIAKTDQAPAIDGDLSDAAWQNAVRIDDWLQLSPIEYRTPSEYTEVWAMYDEDALYFGFYAHDSAPNQITNNVLQQGTPTMNEDKVGLVLDPFNDQRSGYRFELNANGVRSEAIYISGTRPSFDWEGIWNASAKILEDGWTAEFKIPFKSLSFDPANDTWGVNFTRNLQRNQEVMAWYSFNGTYTPTSAGKMTGISNITQGIGLDVIPAISGTSFEDHVVGNTVSELQPSVDIFYKITPQINLAVTVNTDFSATEADSNSLNLSRFRRFFDEKRAFFLNDFDAFKFGMTDLRFNGSSSGNNALAFYSRRIGLSDDGQPVDIVGGIKLSGQAGNTEFGALVMRQDETTITRGGISEIIDPTNAIVARVSHSVLEESKIGFIFTDGNPSENQNNSLYGTDFHYRDTDFYGGKTLDAVLVYQQTNDPDFDDNQSSYSAAFSIGAQEGWYGGAQYFAVEENYSPGLGFTQRTNAELLSTKLIHRWLFDDSIFNFIQVQLGTTRWQDLDTGNLDFEQISFMPVDLHFRRGDSVHVIIDREKQSVDVGENPTGDLRLPIPAGLYEDSIIELRYNSPSYFDVSGELSFSKGDYFTGTFTEFSPELSWQANRHILVDLGYELTKYELPGETIFTREVNFDLTIAFNSKVSLTSQIEYDNVRREASFNNRLRWNIEPGQDLWVVFNQGLVDEDEDYKFAVEDTSAAFKLRYTLRF